MSSAVKLPHHQNNFDLLRIVFASMVVLFHMAVLSQAPALDWMPYSISSLFAVQAFFIVSGYLVTMSFEKSTSLLEYWKKRLLRLAPAYVFVVVMAAILLSTLSTLSFSEYFSSSGFWRYISYNLMLANFSAPSLPGVFLHQYESAVNVSLWTIKIEVLFYACVPAIVWAVRKWGYNRVLGTIFVLSVGWKVAFYLMGVSHNSEFYFKMAKQIPGQLAFFCGGAWCYYKTLEGFRIHPLYAVAGVIAYVVTNGWMFELVSPIAVTLIVCWAAICMPSIGNVGKHGDFSFGIYLYHAPIIQTLVFLGYFSVAPILASFVTVIAVFSVAVLSWNFIERPFLMHRKVAPKTPGVLN